MRERNSLLVALGHIRAGQSKARRVQVIEAQVNTFMGTDGQGNVTKQQITAIGVDLIERATELKAVEHLRPDALTKQQVERFLGKKLRGQGQGPIGKPQAI